MNMMILLYAAIFFLALPLQDVGGAPVHHHHQMRPRPWTSASNQLIWIGDMQVDKERLEMLEQFGPMNGRTEAKYRWPNGVIPFEIDPKYSTAEIGEILDSMQQIEAKSCIRFKKHRGEDDYIFIKRENDAACGAFVGRKGGQQIVHLGVHPNGTEHGTCVSSVGPGPHELIHVVGYWHEQQRPDREEYIQVHTENLMDGMAEQYQIIPGTSTFGTTFDYWSVMLYTQKAFSRNGKPVWRIRKQEGKGSTPYQYVTDQDGAKINAMYKGICY